jgi:hypothetical protein
MPKIRDHPFVQAILGVFGEVDGEEVFLNRIADVAVFKVLGDTNTSLAGLVHLSQYIVSI